MVEQYTVNVLVIGSNPVSGDKQGEIMKLILTADDAVINAEGFRMICIEDQGSEFTYRHQVVIHFVDGDERLIKKCKTEKEARALVRGLHESLNG